MSKEFQEDMLEFKDDMINFKSDMLEFKDDMTNFKSDMLEFKDDMTNFKSDMLEFKDDMTNFKSDMLEFKDDMKEKWTQQDKFNNDIMNIVKDIHRSVLLTENYIHDRIPALLDAYSLNQEQHDEFDDRLNDINNRIDRHSFKINALEIKSTLHSEQLSKLNS